MEELEQLRGALEQVWGSEKTLGICRARASMPMEGNDLKDIVIVRIGLEKLTGMSLDSL